MFKRNEHALSAADVATMLAHAASRFERLAALNGAIFECRRIHDDEHSSQGHA